jgi:hypothetical protein
MLSLKKLPHTLIYVLIACSTACGGRPEVARGLRTYREMENVAIALEAARQVTGGYPAHQDFGSVVKDLNRLDLGVLVETIDPWGFPYQYSSSISGAGTVQAKEYRFASCGQGGLCEVFPSGGFNFTSWAEDLVLDSGRWYRWPLGSGGETDLSVATELMSTSGGISVKITVASSSIKPVKAGLSWSIISIDEKGVGEQELAKTWNLTSIARGAPHVFTADFDVVDLRSTRTYSMAVASLVEGRSVIDTNLRNNVDCRPVLKSVRAVD